MIRPRAAKVVKVEEWEDFKLNMDQSIKVSDSESLVNGYPKLKVPKSILSMKRRNSQLYNVEGLDEVISGLKGAKAKKPFKIEGVKKRTDEIAKTDEIALLATQQFFGSDD